MEQKENQRIRLTKQLLTDALIQMLQEMPLHTVSIRDLCERAGINRTTFYHHYGSQYDLLDDITQRFLGDIAEQLALVDADNRDSVQERVAMVLSYLERHITLARLLLNNNVDPQFAERLLSLPKITDLLQAALRRCPNDELRNATVSFAIYGSYRLLLEWINREYRLPCDPQAALILDLATGACRSQHKKLTSAHRRSAFVLHFAGAGQRNQCFTIALTGHFSAHLPQPVHFV